MGRMSSLQPNQRISAIVLRITLCAGMLVFCSSSQAHERASNSDTDWVSSAGKEESSEVIVPPATVVSFVDKEAKTGSNTQLSFQSQVRMEPGEARNLSPPGIWPTSGDRAQMHPRSDPKHLGYDIHFSALCLGHKARVKRTALSKGPMKTDTEDGWQLSSRGTLLEMVNSLTGMFKRCFSNQGIQAHTSNDNSSRLADRNRNSLISPRVGKSSLSDSSPPGMWPIRSKVDLLDADLPQDEESGEKKSIVTGIRRIKHGRALLRDMSPSGMGSSTSSAVEFEKSRRRAPLANEKLSSQEPANINSPHLKHRRALLRDISPPGMWPITSDDDEFEGIRRRALLSDEKDSIGAESKSESSNHKHGRALLRDISPPGMWPITSDDDESAVTIGRSLLSHDAHSSLAKVRIARQQYKHRRSLLRDISPPGMWPITSDDDEFEVGYRRRALLSDNAHSTASKAGNAGQQYKTRRALLRDISPPGMWLTSDDDDSERPCRRVLLSDGSPHSSSAAATTGPSEHGTPTRVLPSVGRYSSAAIQSTSDISPPGMCPVTSDADEFEITGGRSLLSEDADGTSFPAQPSSSYRSGSDKHRRLLLRDISPPGMWPVTSDDDEFETTRRRALL